MFLGFYFISSMCVRERESVCVCVCVCVTVWLWFPVFLPLCNFIRLVLSHTHTLSLSLSLSSPSSPVFHLSLIIAFRCTFVFCLIIPCVRDRCEGVPFSFTVAFVSHLLLFLLLLFLLLLLLLLLVFYLTCLLGFEGKQFKKCIPSSA